MLPVHLLSVQPLQFPVGARKAREPIQTSRTRTICNRFHYSSMGLAGVSSADALSLRFARKWCTLTAGPPRRERIPITPRATVWRGRPALARPLNAPPHETQEGCADPRRNVAGSDIA